VPNKAIRREEGQKVVSVLEPGGPVRRVVQTGWKDRQYTEIKSGLKEGERVLLEEPAPPAGKPGEKLPPGVSPR